MEFTKKFKKYLLEQLSFYNKKTVKFNLSRYSYCLTKHIGLELTDEDGNHIVDGISVIIDDNQYCKVENAIIDIVDGDVKIEFKDYF